MPRMLTVVSMPPVTVLKTLKLVKFSDRCIKLNELLQYAVQDVAFTVCHVMAPAVIRGNGRPNEFQ